MQPDRRLAAIMFTDVVGYTALMRKDEVRALEVLDKNRKIQRSLIEEYRGEWLKEMGDGVLASFSSASDALRCASRIIHEARAQGIELRIGIHHGEVVFQHGDVFGDGVNIASRVEALAVPGSVLFTEKVYDDIRNKPDIDAVHLGSFDLKNVDEAVEIYALVGEGLAAPPEFKSSRKHSGISSRLWIMGIVAILFAAIVGVLIFISDGEDGMASTTSDAGTTPNAVSVAALPFSNISQDEDIDFLGFALVDEVISNLAYLQNVVVRPSSTIRKYSNEVVDPKEVGAALSVRFVLMGHYIRKEDSVRLNLELIDVSQNEVMWRGAVQEQMRDIFKLQDRVARSVIEGLEVQFSTEERTRMSKDTPDDPLAYEYYLKGLSYPSSVEGNQMALDMLEKAVALDSTFAPAYAEMGVRTHLTSNYSLMEDRGDAIYRARKYFERALELNNESLDALGNLTLLQTEMNKREKALELARRMIEINPMNPLGHFALGYLYRFAGMFDEAIEEMETAVTLDPNDNRFRSIIVTYNMAGRYEDALKAPIYDDGSGFSQSWLGMTYLKMGRNKEARSALTEAIEIDPNSMLAKWCEGMLYYAKGRKAPEEYMEELRVIERLDDPESQYCWSLINVMHEDYDVFLELFEKSVDDGYFAYPAFQIDPLLDPLRDNPAFQRIMEKAKRKHEAFKTKHMPGS